MIILTKTGVTEMIKSEEIEVTVTRAALLGKRREDGLAEDLSVPARREATTIIPTLLNKMITNGMMANMNTTAKANWIHGSS